MLRNTFLHIPHIGFTTERKLWSEGILKWDDILTRDLEAGKKYEHLYSPISKSEQKLRKHNALFFTQRLRPDQHWRLFPEFQGETAYLDIETTGLGGAYDHITTIALYDGKRVYYYVHGQNLEEFVLDIRKYKVLVTYNGKTFDVPFIEREFGVSLPHAHLDLRYILHSLDIKGGLKRCEHQLGLDRGELEGVDGYFAVLLWREYNGGLDGALDTLLAYNMEDTINLEKLMFIAYEKKLSELAISNDAVVSRPKPPKPVKIPFKADKRAIRIIKEKYY
jgi:uncharacterized protein YprB with RNaseH-like and TPR domain